MVKKIHNISQLAEQQRVYLSNKVADNTAIVNAHTRAICVKDPSNPNLNWTNISAHYTRK
jgi:hypothetical protein